MTEPLLMIPGPVPVRTDVLEALAEPVRSHTSAETAASVRRAQRGIRGLVGSEAALVHVFAGSGTLAMEVALVNHARPGDRVVVCSEGFFGDRFAEIATALGNDVVPLRSEWGRRLDPEEVRRACAAGPAPALVTVTHVDTSTGVLADVAGLVAAARECGALVVLDGVCATGAVEESMDAWGVDVVITCAQKGLGLPPGLTVAAVSERARERRAELGSIAAYYADLRRWEPVMEEPTRYFSTHATSLIRALGVSLDAIEAEGPGPRFERHRRVAAGLRAGMAGLGLTPLTEAAALAPTLSVLAVPEGVAEADLRAGMAARGVLVAGCLGAFAGRGIRVGHLGNVGAAEVEQTLRAAASTLGTDPAAALEAAGEHLGALTA
ncbi:MAG: alanine-glyoxylate transaminase / serine-glyoxylate transaminase / serine-pyruvate transaminase [Chloroflexota bacterium]|jgi:aspartate aminotransferase-like enzyme|nr:alanine-glyoxylate transaminase / serine-glyoxylate transaminase / serine-pyruvate transaminase [Chloroflexota bacterium]